MRTLRSFVVSPALFRTTGIEASVGDTVRLYLDQLSVPTFPEYVSGTLVAPIVQDTCRNKTTYNVQYDEADVSGETLRLCDVTSASVEDYCSLLSARLDELSTTDAILALLGVVAYDDLTAANIDLTANSIFYNTELQKLDITTA